MCFRGTLIWLGNIRCIGWDGLVHPLVGVGMSAKWILEILSDHSSDTLLFGILNHETCIYYIVSKFSGCFKSSQRFDVITFKVAN